jgi:hypothetical protein
LPEDTGPLYKILTIEEHGRALFGAIRRMDLEGIVAKRLSDSYGSGTTWYKIGNPGYSQTQSHGGRSHGTPPRHGAGTGPARD